jgi:hypothetical protein
VQLQNVDPICRRDRHRIWLARINYNPNPNNRMGQLSDPVGRFRGLEIMPAARPEVKTESIRSSRDCKLGVYLIRNAANLNEHDL